MRRKAKQDTLCGHHPFKAGDFSHQLCDCLAKNDTVGGKFNSSALKSLSESSEKRGILAKGDFTERQPERMEHMVQRLELIAHFPHLRK